MNKKVYFDDSLRKLVETVSSEWGAGSLQNNVVLRDAAGRLTFVVLDKSRSEAEIRLLAKMVSKNLLAYADGEVHSVLSAADMFEDEREIFNQSRLIYSEQNIAVRLVDRRTVGIDWLQSPSSMKLKPARLVFSSLKGGVGRSTALCVLAAHLSSTGRRVLAIDMDLEAPGLGNLLLEKSTLPEFGLLDYFVESGIQPIDDGFFADMVSPSWLGGGRGRVDVIPALGRRSIENPQNVLAKIGRAYLSGVGFGDQKPAFTGHLQVLLDRVAEPSRYDVVLIDARAGLHETTGAAFLGLGADIFLFGTNQPQTFAGFRLIFAHLASLPGSDEWKARLRVVHAKRQPGDGEEFAEEISVLFDHFFNCSSPVENIDVDLSGMDNTFEVEWTDPAGEIFLDLDQVDPIPPVSIVDDENFRIFDPVKNSDHLDKRFYRGAFSEFLDVATRLVSDSVLNEDSA